MKLYLISVVRLKNHIDCTKMVHSWVMEVLGVCIENGSVSDAEYFIEKYKIDESEIKTNWYHITKNDINMLNCLVTKVTEITLSDIDRIIYKFEKDVILGMFKRTDKLYPSIGRDQSVTLDPSDVLIDYTENKVHVDVLKAIVDTYCVNGERLELWKLFDKFIDDDNYIDNIKYLMSLRSDGIIPKEMYSRIYQLTPFETVVELVKHDILNASWLECIRDPLGIVLAYDSSYHDSDMERYRSHMDSYRLLVQKGWNPKYLGSYFPSDEMKELEDLYQSLV